MDLEIGTATTVTPLTPKSRAARQGQPETDGTSALALEESVLEGTIEPEAVATVEPDRRQEVFATPGGLRPILDHIAILARAHKADLSTDAGRRATASIARQVARCKVRLDDAGKALVDDLKALPKTIDANRKAMRDELDALRDEVRRPLTEWEANQERQKDFVRGIIDAPGRMATATAAQVLAEIERLEGLDLGAAPDFTQDAHTALSVALNQLHTLRKQREQEEADAAELARLRAEEDQRRQEQAEAARKEQEAQQRDQEAPEAVQHTESPHQDTEPSTLERAEVATHQEADGKTADLEHRRTFNREARQDLLPLLGGDAEMAKAILLAIYHGHVRHISITY